MSAPPARRLLEMSVRSASKSRYAGYSFALASIPLPAKLGPIIQPFSNFALEAAVGRIIKSLSAQRFRKIVLSGERVCRVVVVFVAAAIAFRLHQLGRRVQDMLRRQQRTALLCRAHRRAKRLVGGVGFRRGGEIDDGLRDRELAFGMAE